MEKDLVTRKGIPFEEIPAAGVHGVSIWSFPANLIRLSRGYFRSRQIIRKFQPDVLLFTGGYLAVPMALAGKSLIGKSVPQVLYVPDLQPALALKSLARFADGIAVTTAESIKYFSRSDRVIVTGYPVRPELQNIDKHTACQKFGLREDLPILLVFGGSKGAQSINTALINSLPQLLPIMQIIHLSGQQNWSQVDNVQTQLEPELAARYHPYPYLHEEMGAALGAADLVVSRAGASCLGEYPMYGLPAILVPYPYAWRYQQVNAFYLAEQGAAVILQDSDMNSFLSATILDLMANPRKLAEMRSAMQTLARPDAAHQVASFMVRMAEGNRSTT